MTRFFGRLNMEALSRDEFDVVAAHLTPAPLAACMMVSKRVRALTKPHYKPDFIADYDLQQSKWSRTTFTSDVRGVLKQTYEALPLFRQLSFPHGIHISAEAVRLLHLACEHYVYDIRAGRLPTSRLPRYMAVNHDKTIDPDYHPSDSEDSSDESSSDAE